MKTKAFKKSIHRFSDTQLMEEHFLDQYPDQYLYVEHNASGEKWIMPLSPRRSLDIKKLTREFVDLECLRPDDDIISWANNSFSGEYSVAIITDGRHPFGGIVWTSNSFYFIDKSEVFKK